MTRRVAFVGPLPPPVNGFSVMSGKMLDRLQAIAPVDVFNRAPYLHKRVRTLFVQMIRPLRFLGECIRRRDTVLYLALSGGLGQGVDLIYVLIAKLFRRPIFIHHHSFSYIHSPSHVNRLLFRFVRGETHIVLSNGMGKALENIYALDASKIRVVSNAAFFPAAAKPRTAKDPAAPLNIGFLSNITAEKGFVELFQILAQLKDAQVPYQAYIAGPLASQARGEFERLLSCSSNVQYLGPAYGEAKERFYERLDIFLFPTKYLNEAEPLVILEAMEASAHVIACDRGAISEMLANGSGLTFSSHEIVNSAAEHIKQFNRDRAALAIAQDLSLHQSTRIREAAALALESLLNSMLEVFPALSRDL